MEIRNAEIADIQPILILLKESEMFTDYIDTKQALSQKIKNDKESILVAAEKNKVVGCVFIIFDPWSSDIYRLCVKKSFRNNGIGSKLLDKAEDLIKKRGCKLANLFIEEGKENLLDYYKKRGWYFTCNCKNMEKRL